MPSDTERRVEEARDKLRGRWYADEDLTELDEFESAVRAQARHECAAMLRVWFNDPKVRELDYELWPLADRMERGEKDV